MPLKTPTTAPDIFSVLTVEAKFLGKKNVQKGFHRSNINKTISLTNHFRYCTFFKVAFINSLQRSNKSHFSPNKEDTRSPYSPGRARFEENRLPGDNLINQLPLISTPNHSCRRQIAFPSSSLGPWKDKSEGVCLITHMPLCSAPGSSLLTALINVCVRV